MAVNAQFMRAFCVLTLVVTGCTTTAGSEAPPDAQGDDIQGDAFDESDASTSDLPQPPPAPSTDVTDDSAGAQDTEAAAQDVHATTPDTGSQAPDSVQPLPVIETSCHAD